MSSLRLHPRETGERGEEQGVVLVVVLWIMAFLAVLVSSFAYSTQVGLRLAHQKAAQAEARAVAQGALAYAVYSLTRPPNQRSIPPDGSPIKRSLEGGQARISATNLAGLVKLHAVPRALLMRLLARLGIEPERRQRTSTTTPRSSAPLTGRPRSSPTARSR